MRTGRLKSQDDFSALNEAADRLRTLPIYIDDRSGMSTLNIRSTARRMKREHDINLLIVDYLQLITPHETRQKRLARAAHNGGVPNTQAGRPRIIRTGARALPALPRH